MGKLNLKAELTGVGAVNSSYIYLEDLPADDNPDAIAIGLVPKNAARKSWSNEKIVVNVQGTLEYQLNVHAFMGTKWSFVLTDRDTGRQVLSLSGKTGDSGHGKNVSKIVGSI